MERKLSKASMIRIDGKLQLTCNECSTMLFFMGLLVRKHLFDIDGRDVTIYELADDVTMDDCRRVVGKGKKHGRTRR